jgi:Arc/MetJ-type ribon-helix-helix transcriptional regulator
MSPKKRGSTDDPLQKTGYRLPRSLVMRVREAVEAGEAKSQNELVERALRRELAKSRTRRLYASYADAARDPEYATLMEIEADAWDRALGDGLADTDTP